MKKKKAQKRGQDERKTRATEREHSKEEEGYMRDGRTDNMNKAEKMTTDE